MIDVSRAGLNLKGVLLAIANYMKGTGSKTTGKDRLKAYAGFLKAYERVVVLDGTDTGSLPPTRRQQIDEIAKNISEIVDKLLPTT